MHGMRTQGTNPQNALTRSIVVLVLLGLLAAPAAAGGALPDTVRVDATFDETTPDYGVLNFSSIQAAADAVAIEGTISVAAGAYEEWVHIERPVSLVADTGALVCPPGQGVAILIDADNVSVEGFTVTCPTTYGIVVNGFNNADIRNNNVTVVSDGTTTEPPAGIYLKGGTGHVATGNTVTLVSSAPYLAGIVAWEVTDSLVAENRITVTGVYAEGETEIAALAADPAIAWSSNTRMDALSALESESVSIDPIGIVADGSEIVIDGNTIAVTAECLGDENADIRYHAYPVGIDAWETDQVTVTNNEITVAGAANDFTYADGIWAGGDSALVEGNTIDSTAVAESAEPWGIELDGARDGRVLNNNVTIAITADDIGKTYGIVTDNSTATRVLENTVAYTARPGPVSNGTTIESLIGISLNGSTGHTVTGNTVTVEGCFSKSSGIVARGVTDTLVAENCIFVNNVCPGEELVPTALTATSEAPQGPNAGRVGVDAFDIGWFYVESSGIVVNGSEIVIDENTIDVAGECLAGEDNDTYGNAWSVGIDAWETDRVTVTNNRITVNSTATDYATADGIWAGGEVALVEGNTINSTTTAESVDPWGIELYNALKGQVLNNNVTITILADRAYDTYGIIADRSEKAQVLENTVVYDALIGRDGAGAVDAGIEGIYVRRCDQSQVAGNDVTVDALIRTMGTDITLGSADTELSSVASTVYGDLTGESVPEWAGTTGIEIERSDEAWVTGNEIAAEALLMSINTSNVSVVTGGVWSTGLLVERTINAVASKNTIDAGLLTVGLAIGAANSTGVAYANLASEVAGVVLHDAQYTEVSENSVTVESDLKAVVIALAAGPEGEGLIGSLDADLAEDEMDANAFAASLDEEGAYAEAVWDRLNETALARTRTSASAAGIYADTDADTEICENTVDVAINSGAMDIAACEVVATGAIATAQGLAQGFGIIGPSAEDACICGNNVTVTSSGTFTAVAGEGEVSTEDVGTRSQLRTTVHGIVGRASSNDILDNTVAVTAMGNSSTIASETIADGYSVALSSMTTRAVGIRVPAGEDYSNDVSGNTVEVLSVLAPLSAAEATSGEVRALTDGTATGIGIRAPRALIADNRVDVLAQVDNATAIAAEMSALEVAGESVAVANARGIVTRRASIEDNNVFAKGIATATVVAETEELLENADAFVYIAGTGIAIDDRGRSTMTCNTVEGDCEGIGYAYADGYRPEAFGEGRGEALGIRTEGGTATYNNIASGLRGGYKGDTPTHAAYNWWGNASGPSGYGPGTGSPVYGTTLYEPWLTKPADVVLETGKSYFGLEVGSPFIGGDGYREGLEPGWNTLSFPLALENNTWQAVTGAGDGLDYSVACTWDATNQKWVQVTDSARINPLDAIYIKINSYDRLPVTISPEITNPPTRALKAGWNLVGPAYDLVELDEPINHTHLWWGEPYGTSVVEALTSVEYTPDRYYGYTVVVSPSINPETWVFTRGDRYDEPDMDATCGYWVYMENPDTLAGFSSTPLPLPDVGLFAVLQAV